MRPSRWRRRAGASQRAVGEPFMPVLNRTAWRAVPKRGRPEEGQALFPDRERRNPSGCRATPRSDRSRLGPGAGPRAFTTECPKHLAHAGNVLRRPVPVRATRGWLPFPRRYRTPTSVRRAGAHPGNSRARPRRPAPAHRLSCRGATHVPDPDPGAASMPRWRGRAWPRPWPLRSSRRVTVRDAHGRVVKAQRIAQRMKSRIAKDRTQWPWLLPWREHPRARANA